MVMPNHWLLSGTKRWAGFALAANFIEVLAWAKRAIAGEFDPRLDISLWA